MRALTPLPRLTDSQTGIDAPQRLRRDSELLESGLERRNSAASSPFSTPVRLCTRDPRSALSSSLGTLDTESSHGALQRLDGAHRSASGSVSWSPPHWVDKFQAQVKGDFVHTDVTPLLERFEDVSLYRQPHRKPLQTVLYEMRSQTCVAAASDGFDVHTEVRESTAGSNPVANNKRGINLLHRQATDVIMKHRLRRIGGTGYCVSGTEATIRRDRILSRFSTTKDHCESSPTITPTRFLFENTRWTRSARCDYCNLAGGDLECASCDVVAHGKCYLEAYENETRKTKLAFVAPLLQTPEGIKSPFTSWLCTHCQSGLTLEYDECAMEARAAHLATQRQTLSGALTAYVRMTRDAAMFAAKKQAIVRIQAALRGRFARTRFVKLQRLRLKPYAIDSLRVHGVLTSSGASGMSENLGGVEELRLGNGFSCNPFLLVSVVAGDDEDMQLFCFETSVRKPVSFNGGDKSADLEIVWPNEKMFVPGADGNATFCFTLLSKNGPNTFFLGQAVLRLLETGDSWRTGLVAELELSDCVEITPKTVQRQPIRLADAGSGLGRAPKAIDDEDDHNDLDEKTRLYWVLSAQVRPFGEAHSHCGYLGMKATLESFHTSARWCVLADGILRIYRHYGVTLASDMVDMAHSTDVRAVVGTPSVSRTATSMAAVSAVGRSTFQQQNPKLEKHPARRRNRGDRSVNPSEDGSENMSAAAGSLARGAANMGRSKQRRSLKRTQHNCLAVHHLSRLYIFQIEQSAQLRAWLKKLQAAQKFGANQGLLGLSGTAALAAPVTASISSVTAEGTS